MNPPGQINKSYEAQRNAIEKQKLEEWGKKFDELFSEKVLGSIWAAEMWMLKEKFSHIYSKANEKIKPESLLAEAVYEYLKGLWLSKSEKLKIWQNILSWFWIKFEERFTSWPEGSAGSFKTIENKEIAEINSIPEMTIIKRLLEEWHIEQEQYDELTTNLKGKKQDEWHEIIKDFITSQTFSKSENGSKIVENLYWEEKIIDQESYKNSDFFTDIGTYKDFLKEWWEFNYFLANRYVRIEGKDKKTDTNKDAKDMVERSVNDFLDWCSKDFKLGKSEDISTLKKLQAKAFDSPWNFEAFYKHFKSLFEQRQSANGFQSRNLKRLSSEMWKTEEPWRMSEVQRLIQKWREAKEIKPLNAEKLRQFAELIWKVEEKAEKLSWTEKVKLDELVKSARKALASKDTETIEKLTSSLEKEVNQK